MAETNRHGLPILDVKKRKRVRYFDLYDPRDRRYIFFRSGGHCVYCGFLMMLGKFTIDRVEPRSAGGDDSEKNLVPACHRCNKQKGSRTVDQYRRMIRKYGRYNFFDERILCDAYNYNRDKRRRRASKKSEQRSRRLAVNNKAGR